MSFDSAFRPTGLTVLVVGTSSTAGTRVATQWSTGNMSGCWVVNNATVPVYLAWGSSTVQANIPTTGIPNTGLALLSTMGKAFQIGPNNNAAWIDACTSAGSANIYVTPGIGF